MGSSTLQYLRSNVLGLVAIFISLNAGAYAVTTGGGGGDQRRSIEAPALADGAVNSRVVEDRSLAARDHRSRSVGRRILRVEGLSKVLQKRVGNCEPGESIRKVRRGGGVVCERLSQGSITGLETTGGLTGGGSDGDLTLGADTTVLQTRIAGRCPDNQAIQWIARDGEVTCTNSGTGTVTSVGSGAGLTGGPITDSGTLAVDPTAVQSRVTGECTAGDEAITSVAQNGDVSCESTGTVTSVESGAGLTGGPITDSGTLAVDPTAVQARVTGGCAVGESIRAIAEDGTVTCGDVFTGTVTSVGAGTGLTGGPITDSGTLAVDTGVIQNRVSGSCSGTTAVQSVTAAGGANCSPALERDTTVLTPNLIQITPGNTAVLLSGNGVRLEMDCTTTDATAVIRSDTDTNVVGNDASTTSITAATVGPSGLAGLAIGSTTGLTRGDFNAGVAAGPNSARTLSGSYYLFKNGAGCQMVGYGVAS